MIAKDWAEEKKKDLILLKNKFFDIYKIYSLIIK